MPESCSDGTRTGNFLGEHRFDLFTETGFVEIHAEEIGIAENRYQLIPDFFRAFRREFSLATKLWLLVLGVGAVLAVDVYVYFTVAAGSPILLGFTGLLVLVYLICLCWMYPYTAVFQGGFVRTVKMSFLLGLSNLGWSAVMLMTDLGLCVLTLYAPFLTPFLPGLFTLTATLVTGRAFRKYLPKEDG
jgi:uncharacterized membrane protein YesL